MTKNIETTLKCSECGAQATFGSHGSYKKMRGWRVILDDDDGSVHGYLCPKCGKTAKN